MRAHWMRLAVLVTVLSLVAGCTATAPAQPATQTPPTQAPATASPAALSGAPAGLPGSVLFIGDSLSLGLDSLVPRLAASGSPPVTVESKLIWYGGMPLANHWAFSDAPGEIRTGKWDTVVLEEDLGDRWPDGVDKYHQAARQFDEEIKKAGAETVLYMAYPDTGVKAPTTEDMVAAYGRIGQELGVKVAPVALAFQRSLQERPDLKLHAEDGDHPSGAGVYLLSCVLYATITGRSPVGLTYRLQGFALGITPGADWELSEEDAAFLQRIAWETVQDYQAGR